jgi:two-component system sensor histidine kinase TctE
VLGNGAEGSGLGLSIVREIAALHGAVVRIEDNRGEDAQRPGCCVTLVFALLSEASARAAGEAPP